MPRGLRNWTFKDVEKFLKKHGFRLSHTRGSHYFYVKDNKLVPVNFHGKKTYPILTMKTMIKKSGIPQKEWVG